MADTGDLKSPSRNRVGVRVPFPAHFSRIPRDTSPEAWAVYIDKLRKMGPAARIRLMAEMSDAMIELSKSRRRGK